MNIYTERLTQCEFFCCARNASFTARDKYCIELIQISEKHL